MGKVSSLTHFLLEHKHYSFLDLAVTDFEQGLDSIIIDSTEKPELAVSFEEPDGITPSVSSGSSCSVSTISDTSKLQLAPSIKSHMFWC